MIFSERRFVFKKETKEKDKDSVNIKVFIYCFIATVILYLMLVAFEAAIIAKDEKIAVYVAMTDIEENVLITEENFGLYFMLEKRSVSSLPADYIINPGDIIGCLTMQSIKAKEIIIADRFVNEWELITDIENPVEVSLNAANLAQVVGGVIRTGDYINIWSVSNRTSNGVQEYEARLIYEKAYVTRVFTSTGEEINREIDEGAAMIINIVIPSSLESVFNKTMAEGQLRLSRVYDSTDVDKR